MSREQFLRSMVIAIVSVALGMFILYWLVLAYFRVEMPANALWMMGVMIVANLTLVLGLPTLWPARTAGDRPQDVEAEPGSEFPHADPTGIKGESLGPSSTNVREGWRWRWRKG